MKSLATFFWAVVALVVALLLGAVAFAASGFYDIGADAPHTQPVSRYIGLLRDRSTKAHSRDIVVPNLDDPAKISEGAEHYSAMCTGCHLSPGAPDTELRKGLYPQPPNLAEEGIDDPAEAFWIIKHGLKMTAMPAWGKTHTDEQIWNMVAFLQKLPALTPAQYEQLGGKPPMQDEDHVHAGMDEHGDAHAKQSRDAASVEPAPETDGMHTHADGARERHAASGSDKEVSPPAH